MDKNLLLTFISLIALGCMFSCKSDLPEEYEGYEGNAEGEPISITIGMPSESKVAGSRVNFDDTTLKFTWEQSDTLRLVGYDASGTKLGTTDLTMTEGKGQGTATFEGTALKDAVEYSVYYKNNMIDASGNEKGNVYTDYSGQAQTGNSSTAHLKKFLLLKTSYRVKAEQLKAEGAKDSLSMMNSIIRYDLVNVKNAAALTGLTWTIMKSKTEKKEISLKLSEMTDAATISTYISFSGMDLTANNTIKITLNGVTENNVFTVPKTGNKTYEANMRYRQPIDLASGTPFNCMPPLPAGSPLQADNFAVVDANGKETGVKGVATQNQVTGEDYIEFPGMGEGQSIQMNNLNGVKTNEMGAIWIPEQVENIHRDLFGYGWSSSKKPLRDIYLPSPNVVNVEDNTSGIFDIDPLGLFKLDGIFFGQVRIKIHVPSGLLEDYKNHPVWGRYKSRLVGDCPKEDPTQK